MCVADPVPTDQHVGVISLCRLALLRFYQINVTHISPVEVTQGIIAAASRLLKSDGMSQFPHGSNLLP